MPVGSGPARPVGQRNDYLHGAVILVRQDGRRAQLPSNDFCVGQEVRQRIEQTWDCVLPLHDPGRVPVRSLPGYTMAGHAVATEPGAASGQVLSDRVFLQQVVRAESVAAGTEAQWLDAVLDAPGVEIAPARWAPGGRDELPSTRSGSGTARVSASALAAELTCRRCGRARPARGRHLLRGGVGDLAGRDSICWRRLRRPSSPRTSTPPRRHSPGAEQLRGDRPTRQETTWRQAAVAAAGVVSSLSRARTTPRPPWQPARIDADCRTGGSSSRA